MPTPPPVLRLEDTEQPPNGQFGPDSGITVKDVKAPAESASPVPDGGAA